MVYPTKTQAKEAVWKDPNMLFRVINPGLIARQNEIELTLYLKCGSIVILKGADEPDSLRGNDPYGIIFDEFDTMKYEAWEITEPVVRANGGWAWFIGTFKGKKHLWKLKQKGESNNPEWKSWILKASVSKVIPDDQLSEMKQSMSQALYSQELECEPMEGEGSVFRGVRNVMIASPRGPENGHYYSMGVDLAKSSDYSVISVFDRSNNAQVYRDRFNQRDWRYIKSKVFSVAKHYNNALVTIDSTGVGDPIYEDLAYAKINVVSFKFTESSKADLINKLSIWIEQKKLKLINQPEALDEYDNYSYELGPTGKARYGAPDGFHDDIVTADALGVWELHQIYRDETEKPRNRLQQEYDRQVEEFTESTNFESVWNEWNSDV